MWVTHVGWYQTCWENMKERGRQKQTIKISRIVGNCIYRYTKFKKRNMKIIASSITNIYKQVRKWSNENKGISFPPQWESKTDLLLWSHQRREECAVTLFRNTGKKQPWQSRVSRDDVPGLGSRHRDQPLVILFWLRGLWARTSIHWSISLAHISRSSLGEVSVFSVKFRPKAMDGNV